MKNPVSLTKSLFQFRKLSRHLLRKLPPNTYLTGTKVRRTKVVYPFRAEPSILGNMGTFDRSINGYFRGAQRTVSLVMFALALAGLAPLHAADVTWSNGSGTSLWNLTDPNWSTGLWNNANGDGAIFDATGAGAINVTSPINVESLNLIASGYIFNGSGPLTFVDGTSTLATGIINVDTHFDVTINTPINSSLGLVKRGLGTLQLAGPITFSGFGHPITPGTNIILVDIYAAGIPGQTPSDYSGITRIMNTGVLPTTTRVGVSNGLFDFGPLNLTLSSVTFNNDQDSFPFNRSEEHTSELQSRQYLV